jgi:predicted ATPase
MIGATRRWRRSSRGFRERLVTIVGAGGIGKTVALAVAERMMARA